MGWLVSLVIEAQPVAKTARANAEKSFIEALKDHSKN
jgi:hypothetical protein